jgi:4-amino-4-deoxy-L-arabinose transferase-like glycosyltransferase
VRVSVRLLAAALLALALGVRVWRVEATSYHPANDAQSYLTLASQVAHGGDYADTGTSAGGAHGPTAYFPPAFPYFLAAIDVLNGHRVPAGPAVQPARVALAVLGAGTAGLIGLVALEVFGSAVALAALALAAVYPVFIELSGTIYAENLLLPLALAAIWSALRARRSERPYRWIVGAGVLTGLATLTHQNAALLVLPLGWAVWSVRRGWAAPVALLAAAALTVTPWTIRNAIVLHRFIPVSDETGLTLAGTYNPTSAADSRIPYRWRYFKAIGADRTLFLQAGRYTEPQLSSKLQHAAFHYLGHHPFAPLAVAYHNARRLLELEGSFAWRSSAYDIGISGGTAKIGVLSFWLLALLALAGAFTAHARRAPRWLWVVPLLFALSVVFVNADTPRFRAPVDPFVIMLAGCAIATAGARVAPALVGRRATRSYASPA